MPAQSPTLSPTLSAMVAGLRGSSSGMPASTLPTRSAPTSAALVKMPPPTRRNRASSEPPNPNPTRIAELVFWKSDDDQRGAEQAEADGEHAGHAAGAEGHGEGFGHAAGLGGGRRADVATRRQRHADVAGEAGGEAAEEERERAPQPGLGEASARSTPSGLTISVDVKKTISGDRDEDHGDRAELALQVGRGALLDRQRDLLHLRRALVGGEDQLARKNPTAIASRALSTDRVRTAHSPPFSSNACQPPSAASKDACTLSPGFGRGVAAAL